MNIGENIKKFRVDALLTQRELGRRSNITGQYIQTIELGKVNNPSITVLEGISKALHVSVPELLGYEKQKELTDYSTDELIREIRRRTE